MSWVKTLFKESTTRHCMHKKYCFTQPNKMFVLSLHYNDDNSYLFVNGKQELKFKCKTDHLVKKSYA